MKMQTLDSSEGNPGKYLNRNGEKAKETTKKKKKHKKVFSV